MVENITSKSRQFIGLKSWGLVAVLITIIPLAYGFFYFQGRADYLTNHYFRSLSGIEKQINQGLKGMDFLLGFALVDENINLSKQFREEFCPENHSETNYCEEYKLYLKKFSTTFQNIKFERKTKSCIVQGSVGSLNKANDKTCFSITGSFDNKKVTVFDEKIAHLDELEKKLSAKEVSLETDRVINKLCNLQSTSNLKKILTEDEIQEVIAGVEPRFADKKINSCLSLEKFPQQERKKIKGVVTTTLVAKKFQRLITDKLQELNTSKEVLIRQEYVGTRIELQNKDLTYEDIKKQVEDEREVLAVTVPIKDLIDPVPALHYFNRILLLNESGSIIYRSGVDNLSGTSNIAALDDFIRFENLGEYLNNDVDKELEIKGKDINYKNVTQVTSHSRVRKATIAGIPYLLYIQPFHAVRKQNLEQTNFKSEVDKPELIGANTEKLAYIVGIIPTEKNKKAIMSLPFGRINMLFFAILIILLLTPHFKLLFSGPRFMPTRTFVAWLVISFPLLAMVLVLSAVSAYDYFQLKQSLDNTAKEVAVKISANFKKEFKLFNEVLRPEFYLEQKVYHDLKPDENRLSKQFFSILQSNSENCIDYLKFSQCLGNSRFDSGIYMFPSVESMVKMSLYPKSMECDDLIRDEVFSDAQNSLMFICQKPLPKSNNFATRNNFAPACFGARQNAFNSIQNPMLSMFYQDYNNFQNGILYKVNTDYLPMYISENSEDLKDIMLAQPAADTSKKYPIFELAYYLDSEGKQTGKQITYRAFPATNIKVHRRQYFKQSYYHPEKLSIWPKNLKYYSERIETYDHGLKLTALSFPVADASGCPPPCDQQKNKPQNAKVLAILKLMHTFFKPVLPAGFGFAVIKDSSGEVIYHSNDQRSLLENFYIETDENQQIMTTARMRHERLVSGNYNGLAHNFWITPLNDTPWSLVVFYETGLMELANIKTSILSVVFSFMVIFLLLLILAFCYCTNKSCLLSFLVNMPNGVNWREIKQRLSVSCFIKVYTFIVVFLLLLVFGQIIAAHMFKFVNNNQVKKMLKYNLVHIESSLMERHIALMTEVSRVTNIENSSPEAIQYLNKELLQFANYTEEPSGLNQNVSNGSPNGKSSDSLLSGYYNDINPWLAYYFNKNKLINCDNKSQTVQEGAEFIDEIMPILGYIDSQHQLLAYPSSTDKSWNFCEDSKAGISAVFNAGTGFEFQLRSTGNYTKIQDIEIPYWWYFYLYLITPLLLYFLVKLTSVRLLGLDFQQQQSDLHENVSKYASEQAALEPNNLRYDPIVASKNFEVIAYDESEQVNELRSILYNLSHNQLVNYTNAIPVMQLIESGILQQENGMLVFRDLKLKKWISHQAWGESAREYQVQDTTNLWSVLAMPFYSIIFLAIIFLVLSGGKIGELMLALVPIILTGGIPFISSLLGKRFEIN